MTRRVSATVFGNTGVFGMQHFFRKGYKYLSEIDQVRPVPCKEQTKEVRF